MLDDGWVNSHSGDTLSQGETHDDDDDDNDDICRLLLMFKMKMSVAYI